MLPKDTPHQVAGFSGPLVSNRDQPFGILRRWPHQSSYPLILSENPFLFLSPLFPPSVCATHTIFSGSFAWSECVMGWGAQHGDLQNSRVL